LPVVPPGLRFYSPAELLNFDSEDMVLVFEDNFDELDMDTWSHDITMAGGGNW